MKFIVKNNEEIPAHRGILAVRSEVLKKKYLIMK